MGFRPVYLAEIPGVLLILYAMATPHHRTQKDLRSSTHLRSPSDTGAPPSLQPSLSRGTRLQHLLRLPVFCLLAGTLLGCPSSPQDTRRGFEPGYIVTIQGDTLRGYIRDRAPEPFVELYRRIRFREEGRRGQVKLGPWDIQGYRAGGREYASVPLREDAAFFRFRYYTDYGAPRTFLRLVKRDGPLTYYRQEFTHDDNDFLDFFPLFHLEGEREMVRVTQGVFGLKRERLAEYFRDCEALVHAVMSKALTHPDEVYDFYLEHCGQDRAW